MTTIANNIYYNQLDTLNGMERELYRILNTFSDNKTKECYPSIATLTKLFKSCRNTTKKYLRQLENKGFIHIQERKVKHKVTDNKFNETHKYTLLLEKFKGAIRKKDNDDEKSSPVVLAETDLDRIIRELGATYNKESVTSALKTMRKNMRSGSIISNMKNYLEALITKSSNQLQQVNKALESSVVVEKGTSNTKHQASNHKPNKNDYRTKFHNFEQRTSQYTSDELNDKIHKMAKAKIDKLLNK